MNGDPAFAADAMLGRLARWLRALGYDTSYDAALQDPVLVDRANAESRVLLTRDRLLLRELRPALALEVRQDDPLAQLRHVTDALDLPATGPRELFTRCLLCNCLLLELDAGEAQGLLPPGVRGIPGPVRRCPCCARLYWDGSHVRRMRTALERVLPRGFLIPRDLAGPLREPALPTMPGEERKETELMQKQSASQGALVRDRKISGE